MIFKGRMAHMHAQPQNVDSYRKTHAHANVGTHKLKHWFLFFFLCAHTTLLHTQKTNFKWARYKYHDLFCAVLNGSPQFRGCVCPNKSQIHSLMHDCGCFKLCINCVVALWSAAAGNCNTMQAGAAGCCSLRVKWNTVRNLFSLGWKQSEWPV